MGWIHMLKYYYENNFTIFKLEGRLHKKIVLYNINYKKHIKSKHAEISMKIIEEVLKDPDFIYKPSRNSDDYYYEKRYRNDFFRVVISKYKKLIKSVITAYRIDEIGEFSRKHVHCVYDKETFVDYEYYDKALNDDRDYFYTLFNIAE